MSDGVAQRKFTQLGKVLVANVVFIQCTFHTYSDDNQILSWSVSTNQPTKIAQLDKDVFATDMQFLPRTGTSLGKHGDLILVTSADGK